MWSLDGSSVQFPNDSAITVGGNSSIQLLVLQVHYIENTRIPRSGDTSGVLVNYYSSDIRPDRGGSSRKLFESRANRVIDCQVGSSPVILRFEFQANRVKI